MRSTSRSPWKPAASRIFPPRTQTHFIIFITIGYRPDWRSGEIRNLRVKNVEKEVRGIRFFQRTTKNDEGRLMILPDDSWKVIESCLEGKGPNDYVVTLLNGTHTKS
jgi:integrase